MCKTFQPMPDTVTSCVMLICVRDQPVSQSKLTRFQAGRWNLIAKLKFIEVELRF